LKRAVIAGVLTLIMAAGVLVFARLQPLSLGSLGPGVRTSTTGFSVSQDLVGPSTVVIKNELGAKVTVEFSVMTRDWPPVQLVDLDATVEEWRESIGSCFWRPLSAQVLSSGSFGEPQRQKLSLPHTLEPLHDVIVQVSGEIGDRRAGPCPLEGIAVGWLEAPLRFRWLGITKTQTVPLDLRLGISDDPARYTKAEVNSLPGLG
jgi:hypothetical protein